jgi:hypothetical protein
MKELHHFEMAALFDGLEPTDGYQTFHAGFGFLRPMIGAVTPSYIVFPQALERIQRYNPEAKIIALLRNPVLRPFPMGVVDAFGNRDRKLPGKSRARTRRPNVPPRIFQYSARAILKAD